MASQVANRFALFAEDEEALSTQTKQMPRNGNPIINQAADDDAPWEEVKRGNTRGQGQTPKLQTLGIRTRPKQRDVSGSTQASSNNFEDPHENWCGVCSSKFNSKSTLLSHIKTSPGDHSNYCNLCKRVFKDRNGLKNHVENSLGHQVFCNLCLSAFKNDWALKNHFENNYAVGHQFVCLTCLLGFRTNIELTRHLHTGKKHVVCNTCQRIFRNQHERDAHWSETTKHKHCLQPGCDFDAPNAHFLEKHLEEDHFRCEGCKRILPSQTKLTQHYETCKFEVPCPHCGERCAGQGKLALHQETCIGTHNSSIRDANEDDYLGHTTTTTHTASASAALTCFTCSAAMPSSTALITHLERGRCPSLPDPALLTLCLGKWWYSPLFMDLDLHAQIRRNEVDLKETTSWMEQGFLRPFACRGESCSDTFARFSELVAHVESGKCAWHLDMLRLDLLMAEMGALMKRRDSVVG